MSAQQTTFDNKSPSAEIDVEKHSSNHQEIEDGEIRKENGDYSGAVAKKDPAEVKLVRKLDIWIMVGCFSPVLGI